MRTAKFVALRRTDPPAGTFELACRGGMMESACTASQN
jgi:hypothetical protein